MQYLVSRSHTRPVADLYLFNLADLIPCFSVPLQANDQEPIVDLQTLLNEVYDRSGYNYFVDYRSDSQPPLAGAALA